MSNFNCSQRSSLYARSSVRSLFLYLSNTHWQSLHSFWKEHITLWGTYDMRGHNCLGNVISMDCDAGPISRNTSYKKWEYLWQILRVLDASSETDFQRTRFQWASFKKPGRIEILNPYQTALMENSFAGSKQKNAVSESSYWSDCFVLELNPSRRINHAWMTWLGHNKWDDWRHQVKTHVTWWRDDVTGWRNVDITWHSWPYNEWPRRQSRLTDRLTSQKLGSSMYYTVLL